MATDGIRFAVVGLAGLAAVHPAALGATRIAPDGTRVAEPLIKPYWKERSEKNESVLRKFLTIDATRWQYTQGVRNPNRISPDTCTHDQALIDREGS